MNNSFRKTPPAIANQYSIAFPEVSIVQARNSIPVHVIRTGTQNILKLDIIFDAGTRLHSPLIPKATADLMVEATKSFDSETLSNLIDNNGAYLYSEIDRDRVSISLVVLEKFFDNLIEPFHEAVLAPRFDMVDFERYKVKRKQQHIQSLEKTSNLASREFVGQLFGKNHPYGRMAMADDYDTLRLENLVAFYHQHYVADGTFAIITGQFTDKTFQRIMNLIESIPAGKGTSVLQFEPHPEQERTKKIKKMDATQATVKVGGFAINRSHPDYPKLKIVNTLLGGYFGSRLMQVIREQKGLTYGIGSSIVSLEHSGYWTVQGDVLLDKVDEVITDIGLEIERLKTDLVEEEELTMIKNYLRGDILQQFDGPFTIGDTYRDLADFGLNFSYFDTLQQAINDIDSLNIREIANKYLDFEKAKITIAGGE